MSLNVRPQVRCVTVLERLALFGYELRRPHVENLGDGIYELRVKIQNVNYRMLYFFHGQRAVVLSHGKQESIEIQRSPGAV